MTNGLLLTKSCRVGKLSLSDPEMLPPRKSTAALFIVLVLTFMSLWIALLLPAIGTRVPPQGSTIIVMDLTLVLPLLLWIAYLLLKKQRIGDLLAVAMLVKAAALGLSVLLGCLLAPLYDLPLSISSIGVYSLLGIVPLLLITPYLKKLTVATN